MRVCTVQEMRDLDRRATDEYGLPGRILMENAGHAVYEVLRSEYGIDGRRYVVICGRGNNGGDGFVVARKLFSNGADVRVYLLSDEADIQGAAKDNLEAALKAGIPLQRLQTVDDLYLGRQCDVVVDALFGTGIARQVDGLEAAVIERVNESSLPVVSVDIPSGVDGDSGAIHGIAVRADCTVTFGLPKAGNLLPPGRELCGRLFLSHISFPPAMRANDGALMLNRLTPLPPRPLESHKGTFGEALVIAGAGAYLGAPALCALSFLKTGGGYVRLTAPRSIAPLLAISASEAVLMPLNETCEGTVALSNLEYLRERAALADVVVLGPGLSINPETQQVVRELAPAIDCPLVLDGDGLTAISGAPGALKARTKPTLLTPHLGEIARLLDWPIGAVVADRVGAAREAARLVNAIVLLKGASTLVCDSTGVVSINLSGNPGMATAGCGDVLSGVVAALVGLGLAPRQCLETGAFLHGLAGDLAARDHGEDGIVARDVMNSLPGAVRLYRSEFLDMQRNFYGKVVVI